MIASLAQWPPVAVAAGACVRAHRARGRWPARRAAHPPRLRLWGSESVSGAA